MAQKYWPPLTQYPARNGQRILAPVFWYIILICYQHVTPYYSPWPSPLLLYESEHYALTSDKVLEWKR